MDARQSLTRHSPRPPTWTNSASRQSQRPASVDSNRTPPATGRRQSTAAVDGRGSARPASHLMRSRCATPRAPHRARSPTISRKRRASPTESSRRADASSGPDTDSRTPETPAASAPVCRCATAPAASGQNAVQCQAPGRRVRRDRSTKALSQSPGVDALITYPAPRRV